MDVVRKEIIELLQSIKQEQEEIKQNFGNNERPNN